MFSAGFVSLLMFCGHSLWNHTFNAAWLLGSLLAMSVALNIRDVD